jgi:predicted nucleic acid-binding protein
VTRRRSGRRGRAGAGVVVDASIAVQWFANEPGSERALLLLESEELLVAPDLMAAEAANAWWKKVRRREMTATDYDEALAHLLAVGIEWVPVAPYLARAAKLALEHAHPVYDCLYLALAAERRVALLTADAALRKLASRQGIELWPEA